MAVEVGPGQGAVLGSAAGGKPPTGQDVSAKARVVQPRISAR
jgi:hypothetical protein